MKLTTFYKTYSLRYCKCIEFFISLFQHMVQNQMTPTYQYATAQTPGLEEYGHPQVVVSQASLPTTAVSVEAAAQFKPDQTPYPATTVTANGGVEQQTVRARPLNVRDFLILACP